MILSGFEAVQIMEELVTDLMELIENNVHVKSDI
jgi:hypothetical protein